MIGPEKRYSFTKRPWTLLDRIAVAFLMAVIAFGLGFFLWTRTHSRHNDHYLFSFDTLLWCTGGVALITFLLTFIPGSFDE